MAARGRAERISAYIGDKTPSERAFWDAAEEFRFPDDHARAGKVHWAAFMRYLADLVLADRERQSRALPKEDDVQAELAELRREVDCIKQMVSRGELTPRETISDQVGQTVKNENALAKKAAKLAEEDW